ncbi:hypothetical protein BH23CHL4_BH23CHL4_16330 [soil metagenome]
MCCRGSKARPWRCCAFPRSRNAVCRLVYPGCRSCPLSTSTTVKDISRQVSSETPLNPGVDAAAAGGNRFAESHTCAGAELPTLPHWHVPKFDSDRVRVGVHPLQATAPTRHHGTIVTHYFAGERSVSSPQLLTRTKRGSRPSGAARPRSACRLPSTPCALDRVESGLPAAIMAAAGQRSWIFADTSLGNRKRSQP